MADFQRRQAEIKARRKAQQKIKELEDAAQIELSLAEQVITVLQSYVCGGAQPSRAAWVWGKERKGHSWRQGAGLHGPHGHGPHGSSWEPVPRAVRTPDPDQAPH